MVLLWRSGSSPFLLEDTIQASPQMRAGLCYISGIGLPVLHLHHAAEAHEGHSEDTGGDEGDGNALHRGG